MYTRKEISDKAVQARIDGDLELSGMLEHLISLKFSWIRQIKKRFLGPDDGGLYTPHQCKLRKEVVEEWYNKYFK